MVGAGVAAVISRNSSRVDMSWCCVATTTARMITSTRSRDNNNDEELKTREHDTDRENNKYDDNDNIIIKFKAGMNFNVENGGEMLVAANVCINNVKERKKFGAVIFHCSFDIKIWKR